MSIETYGSGERIRIAASLLSKRFVDRELVLFPVPSSRDGRHISGTDIGFEQALGRINSGCVAVGYAFPTEFERAAVALGAQVFDLSKDEKYILDNAHITAHGALGYIITTDARVPKDIKFGIVGYGRIGSELVKCLAFLGAYVKVYSTRQSVRLMLGDAGISSGENGEISDAFESVDILINTAPTNLAGYFPDGKIKRGHRIIELASGKNFEGVEGVEYLPSLPEKMHPESAARTYFEATERFLEQTEKQRK